MIKRVVLVMGVTALASAAVLPVNAQTVTPPHYSPKVITVRPDGVEKTVFERGERVVVLGEGFPKLAPAYVLFKQSAERLLAAIRTTARGTFRVDVHVPFAAAFGPAAIRGATFAKISTIANITVVSTPVRTIPTHDRDVVLLGGGGIALVVVGLAMTGFVWWRRRRHVNERSNDQRDKLDQDDRDASSTIAKLRKDVARWKDR